jgi:hypothetical protein
MVHLGLRYLRELSRGVGQHEEELILDVPLSVCVVQSTCRAPILRAGWEQASETGGIGSIPGSDK